MQSNFDIADLTSHQHYMDANSSSPSLPIFFNPHNQNQNHPSNFHHQLQHQQLSHHLVHPTPITHELFQGLHPQPEQQQSGTAQWQMSPLNFKLGLNENSILLDENSPLFLQSRQQNLGFKSWQPQEFCNRKEQLFWKPSETEGIKQKQEAQGEMGKEMESKYRLYGELEAIYSIGRIGEVNNSNNRKQTGSGSALANENSHNNVELVPLPFGGSNGLNVGQEVKAGVDDGSDDSIEKEVVQKRKRKRRMKEEMCSSTTRFFEGLVKRVMDHQERLHNKYLALVEKMDRERRERDEAWRLEEAEKHKREAIAQLHEQALASKRESLIVSYIEKITGEKVNLPSRETSLLLQCDYSNGAMEEELTSSVKGDQANSRWPQSEVEALILVRSNIEYKFQEPGLKGPLWEQVSASMAALGYQRSARRCKEKCENINKYFRKTKDIPKKRSQQSKTCSYFNQLDQLYSRTPITTPSSSSVSSERQGYSELLQAVISGNDTGVSQNLCNGSFGLISKMVEHLQEDHGKEKENHEDDGSMEAEEEDFHGDGSDE